jgi:hypothetical protein
MKKTVNKDAKKRAGVAVKGGNTSMMKQQFTGTQKPGMSSQEHSKSSGDGAKGGNTKMFGKQKVKAAKPA